MEPQRLTIQINKPGSKAFPHGRVEVGYWTEDDGYVWRVTADGTKLGNRDKVRPGIDNKILAVNLLRASVGKRASDFNRPLRYADQPY